MQTLAGRSGGGVRSSVTRAASAPSAHHTTSSKGTGQTRIVEAPNRVKDELGVGAGPRRTFMGPSSIKIKK